MDDTLLWMMQWESRVEGEERSEERGPAFRPEVENLCYFNDLRRNFGVERQSACGGMGCGYG